MENTDNLCSSDYNHMEMKKNRIVCCMIKRFISDFFDNIYVPYKYFRKDSWNILETLNNNEDILFFNKNFMTKSDKDRFYEVFDKFVIMVGEILCSDSDLYECLKNMPDTSIHRINKNSDEYYILSLFNNRKYCYISPVHILQIYDKYSRKYTDQNLKLKTENELNSIIKNVRKEINIFKTTYDNLTMSYVCEKPFDNAETDTYVKGFVNSIMLEILDFAEKLIDLNIYAVHIIITEIIDYCIPLDDINAFDPNDNDGRYIFIV
ncbi:hypothetical protein QLL95_gp0836 [Cotonvirus japonicus]|uniref:Uncharacterized protein n=1 Tax=Cotonvirus japonicus TaxID=2811091 RepID=A0ABM7NT83_9VIRU|nr:hypothetical protein QLL95_gp0836 [Cotonvirus japonicus]BCS83287.1 hypothetical protein [Cotonvirus japonicus]